MTFIVCADLVGVLAGLTLLLWGGLGWAGRYRVLSGGPPRSAANRLVGRAWAGVGAGALITVASDLITSPDPAIITSWAGATLMVIAFLAGLRTRRRHGPHRLQ